MENAKVEGQFKSGANWFFWIAGLSLINSIVLFTGREWSFIIGLGATQVIDAIALSVSEELGNLASLVALLLDLFVVGIFVIFGLLARKRHGWAFVVGMVFYAIDGLIFVVVRDFVGIGFHLIALFFIFNGFRAARRMGEMEKAEHPSGRILPAKAQRSHATV